MTAMPWRSAHAHWPKRSPRPNGFWRPTDQPRRERVTTMAVSEHQAETDREEIEEAAAEGVGILLRGAEIGLVVLIGLLLVPPLAILAVVVVVPFLARAVGVGVPVAIVAPPYVLARHVREHHRTHGSSAVAHHLGRLRAREA